jgi:hypothetical protein
MAKLNRKSECIFIQSKKLKHGNIYLMLQLLNEGFYYSCNEIQEESSRASQTKLLAIKHILIFSIEGGVISPAFFIFKC